MRLKTLIILIGLALASGAVIALGLVLVSPASPDMVSAYVIHDPVSIDGNADLTATATAEGWPGDGTSGNPYVIENLEISASTRVGIDIRNTTLYFVIRSSRVRYGASTYDGIYLYNVENGSIDGCVLENNRYGIRVKSSSSDSISNSTVSGSQSGIVLESCSGVSCTGNALSVNSRDVDLTASSSNEFTNNYITIASRQTGFYFGDAASYNNQIDASNTVNDVPVRWYTNVAGTEGSPVALSGYTVELTDITNVAQVMLYKCSYVNLSSSTAKYGSGDGILLYESTQTSVTGSTAEGNAGDGVEVKGGSGNRVNGNTLLSNNVGISLSSQSNTVSGNTIRASKSHGISLSESSSNTANVIQSNTIDANLGDGIYFKSAKSNTVLNNTISNHTRGVHLDHDVSGNQFAGNVLSIDTAKSQYGFYFYSSGGSSHSYNNQVDSTNTVNGVPVRWYTDTAGTEGAPVTISSNVVELKGITNIAQVMLYKCSYVDLAGATAKYGAGDGIVLYESTQTSVTGATIESNAGDGVQIWLGSGNSVNGNSIASNNIGVFLHSGSNTLSGNTIRASKSHGISLAEYSGNTANLIQSNTIDANLGYGIHLRSAGSNTIQNNIISNHTRNVHLDHDCSGNQFSGNVVTIDTSKSEYGFYFYSAGGSAHSYNNEIDATNTVNGVPVRWYTNVAGTEGVPVTISGNVVDLKGITNIAQIMFYNCSYVNLAGATARYGAGDGIVLYESTQTLVTGSTIESNSGDGVQIWLGAGNSVSGNSIASNNIGVFLHSGSNTLSGNTIRASKSHGISLTEYSGNTANVIQLNTIDANLGDGIYLRSAKSNTIRNNTISNHTKNVHLDYDCSGNQFSGNTLTIDTSKSQYGFYFYSQGSSSHSYDNQIDSTNKVNSVPVRWYTNVAGAEGAPVTMSGDVVELKGITNIAQIMLYKCSYVSLSGSTAKSGTGDGVVLYESTQTSVTGSTIESNSGDGVQIWLGSGNSVSNNSIASNNIGVVLHSGSNMLSGNTIRASKSHGISLTEHSGNTANVIQSNTIDANQGDGIYFRSAKSNIIQNNTISNHTRNVHLDYDCSLNQFSGNILTIDTSKSQYGFYFYSQGSSAHSYNNQIDSTNKVNNVAMCWYTGAAGVEGAPVTISGDVVELKGITNIAQIMLFQCSYVSLSGSTANYGAGAGILAYESSTMVISECTTSHNECGIRLELTLSTTLENNIVSNNAYGIYLAAASKFNRISATTATYCHDAVYIADAQSVQNTVYLTDASHVAGESVHDPTFVDGSPTRGSNLVCDAGLDKEINPGSQVRFSDSVGVSSSLDEPIVYQEWEFGDGAHQEISDGDAFHPTHTYTTKGAFVARYTITVAHKSGNADYSDTVLVNVALEPSAPQSLQAAPGNRKVTLFWLEPTDKGDPLLTGYRLYRQRSSGSFELVAELGNVMTYTDTGLEIGESYRYKVTAVNGIREGPQSNEVSAVPFDLNIEPGYGRPGQTLDVVISSGDFSAGVRSVSFGKSVTVNGFTAVGSTQITVNITIAADAKVGTRDVSITDSNGGVSTFAGAFTVSSSPPPSITQVNPPAGHQGWILDVVITGTDLTGASEVNFGSGITVTSFKVDSPTQISASITIAATAAAGAREVSLTTPGGTGRLGGAFTVTVPPPPTITGTSPSNGEQGDKVTVVIGGSDFYGATKISFGPGIRVSSFTVDSQTQITAKLIVAGDAAVGTRSVTVTTAGGDATLADCFTVEARTSGPLSSGWIAFGIVAGVVALVAGSFAFTKIRHRGGGGSVSSAGQGVADAVSSQPVSSGQQGVSEQSDESAHAHHASSESFCGRCGAATLPGDGFCPSCGARLAR